MTNPIKLSIFTFGLYKESCGGTLLLCKHAIVAMSLEKARDLLAQDRELAEIRVVHLETTNLSIDPSALVWALAASVVGPPSIQTSWDLERIAATWPETKRQGTETLASIKRQLDALEARFEGDATCPS